MFASRDSCLVEPTLSSHRVNMEAALADLRGPHLFANDTYEDITPQLREQAAALGEGGVKKMIGSQMFDSLPAFQVGVQKLDTGSPEEFKTLDEEINAANHAFPLTSEANCVALFDLLKQAEMAWQKGYSGMQTLLVCLLVEKELQGFTQEHLNSHRVSLSAPQKWDFPAFVQVYVWGMIRGMALSMQIIDQDGLGVIFPEEDFHSMQYNYYFLGDVPVQTVVELLEQARKAAKTSGYNSIAAHMDSQNVWLTVLNQHIPRKSTNLQKMEELINKWTVEDSHSVAYANWFTRGVQARADGACLRLNLQPFSHADAKAVWLRILEGITHILTINSIQNSTELLGVLLNFSGRQELPIVRAMVKSRFTESQALGQSTKTWAARDIMETVAFPASLQKSGAAKTALDQFTGQAALCYVDLMSSFTMNRCRLREALCGLVISFDSLQVTAEQVDSVFTQLLNTPVAIVSSWTLFRKLQVMMWIVLLGFETDALNYSERAFSYWYAYRLCQNLLSHIQRMRSGFELVPGGRDSSGYGYLSSLELESQMLQQLCMAELLIWIVLHKFKPPKEPAHSTAEMRFRLRFRMFESVGVPEPPSLVDYEEFASQWDVNVALQGAANAAKTARTLLQPLAGLAQGNNELALLQRSAMALSITVMKLVKLKSPPNEVTVETKDYHGYFPIPGWSQN